MNNIIYNRAIPGAHQYTPCDAISNVIVTQECNGAAVWTESALGEIQLDSFFFQKPRETALEYATQIATRLIAAAENELFYPLGGWHECGGLELL